MLLTSVFILNIISQSVIQKTVNGTEYLGGNEERGGFMTWEIGTDVYTAVC